MPWLFLGRSTIDMSYVCDGFPSENSKATAAISYTAPGGPALNAAVTYAGLGGRAELWTAMGEGPFGRLAKSEVAKRGVAVVDLAGDGAAEIPVSAIIINRANGSRTIINQPVGPMPVRAAPPEGAGYDGVLLDGFLPEVAMSKARAFKQAGVVTVLDGGSWKPHSKAMLEHISVAIVSETFAGSLSPDVSEAVRRIHAFGPRLVAVTRGEKTIIWSDGDTQGEIAPPQTPIVDTLGAGDVFHGAFCYYLSRGEAFPRALQAAAVIAANSCTDWGVTHWIDGPKPS